MNLAALAPQWAVMLLMGLLALAALQDSIQLKISNLICGAVLLLAIVVVVLVGFRLDLWQNFLVFAATLTVGTMLFSAGKLGGGDVKLFACTVFWFDFSGAMWLLLSVAIAGGVLAMLIIALRSFGWSEAMQQRAVILRRKAGIPYGVAIAAGALLSVSMMGPHQPIDPRTNWSAVPGRG